MNVAGEIASGLIYHNTDVAKEVWPLSVYVNWIAELFGVSLNTLEGFNIFRDWIYDFVDGSHAYGLIGDENLEMVLASVIDYRQELLPY